MKKFFYFFAVLCIVSFTFFSCQKEELNTEAIRAQLVAQPALTVAKVQLALSRLKDGNGSTLVVVFPLSGDNITVFEDHADKYFVYYEINGYGQREKIVQIKQTFPIINGNVDLTQWNLDYEIGCPLSKIFILSNQNNIMQINYFFRFNDGKQFAFFGQNYSGQIKLPPIEGGKWQLEITYNDGDLEQKYSTKMIDINGDSMLNLDFKLKEENVISYVEMDNILTQGAYLVQLALYSEETGQYTYINYPLLYEENQVGYIYFSAPFDVRIVTICGVNGCKEYYTKNMGWSIRNGKKVYRLQ